MPVVVLVTWALSCHACRCLELNLLTAVPEILDRHQVPIGVGVEQVMTSSRHRPVEAKSR